MINNIDYRKYLLKSLREQISAVFQNYGKYHFTIEENTTMSIVGDSKHVLNTLRQVSFPINKHKGLKTLLGKAFEGDELSGGQWQRLAIARCLYKNSSVVLLDEPTSSIDPKAEVEIYKLFSQLTKDKISILVTHRLGSINLCDKVLVLDNGQLVQFDTSENLKNQNGKFKELWNLQASMYE